MNALKPPDKLSMIMAGDERCALQDQEFNRVTPSIQKIKQLKKLGIISAIATFYTLNGYRKLCISPTSI